MSPDTAQAGARTRTRVTIGKDGMTAMLVIAPPISGELELTPHDVLAELDRAGVVYGVNEEVIRDAIVEKRYNTPLVVAHGTVPVKGENSQIVYNFNASNNHSPRLDRDGRIDYKAIDFIQNATAGQVLATRRPATAGKPGISVSGREVAAPAGRDIPFRQGANTIISPDGLTLNAACAGAIVCRNGEISIKDVMTISGDVDHNVGNLECRGSLRISGDIRAGYVVKADGDIEVNGNVEDATVSAKGNIMVKGGFFGYGSGIMHADGNVTVKFAEGQRVTAGGDIVAGGELINCSVIARNAVWVKGKHGKIVGGETRAGKVIRAPILGSEAGTATVVAVAFDADLMRRHHEVTKELCRLKTDAQRIKEAMYALYRLQMDGKLTAERAAALAQLETFVKELPANLEALEKQKAEIEEKMRELRDSHVIAEERLFPGVKVYFGLTYREILEDLKACRLICEGNQVLMTEFKPESRS